MFQLARHLTGPIHKVGSLDEPEPQGEHTRSMMAGTTEIA
jgi:hypothetical protein